MNEHQESFHRFWGFGLGEVKSEFDTTFLAGFDNPNEISFRLPVRHRTLVATKEWLLRTTKPNGENQAFIHFNSKR